MINFSYILTRSNYCKFPRANNLSLDFKSILEKVSQRLGIFWGRKEIHIYKLKLTTNKWKILNTRIINKVNYRDKRLHLLPHPCTPCIISVGTWISCACNWYTWCRSCWSIEQRLTGLLPWVNELFITIVIYWPICSPDNKG